MEGGLSTSKCLEGVFVLAEEVLQEQKQGVF